MNTKESVFRVFLICGLIFPLLLANPSISSGQSNSGGRYAWEKESPYFRSCNVQAVITPTSLQTVFFAEVYDPNGAVPGTISALRVTHPNGTTHDDFDTSEDYTGSSSFSHSVAVSSMPSVGTYTFKVTDSEGLTSTTHFHYTSNTAAGTFLESTALQAAGDSSSVILSWGAEIGILENLFYQVRIFGQAGNLIWASGFAPQTSLSIPGNILSQVLSDPGPRWRVMAYDNHVYVASNLRTVSSPVSFAIDNTTPYFENAVIFRRRDGDGSVWTQVEILLRDPGGELPSSIDSLVVRNPHDAVVCSTGHPNQERRLTYDPSSKKFVAVIPVTDTSPIAGGYMFRVNYDGDKTKTTYDYLAPGFDIPKVDSSTCQASGNPLAPTLSWAAQAVMHRPLYYQVIISESGGATAWESGMLAETAIVVPSGRLQAGASYTWQVRTSDNEYYGHLSNQGRSTPVALAVNPSPNPYFKWAAVHRRKDPDGSFTVLNAAVIDPVDTMPGSITSLTVRCPSGNTYDLKADGTYSSSSGEFILRAAVEFEPGVYSFTLVKGGFTLVTHDWVGNAAEMPLVDQRTIAASGDPAAPTVSWSGISGFPGNVYYRLRVQDSEGNVVYRTPTPRQPFTAQNIPPGILQSGQIYLASIEAQEHPDWVTYNTRSNSAYVWWRSDGEVMTLADAIVCLQVLVGLSPADAYYIADVNQDGRLGLEEVIYALQHLAGMRP